MYTPTTTRAPEPGVYAPPSSNGHRVPSDGHVAEISLASIVRPFLRNWRWVAAALALAWSATLAIVLVPPREFTAELTLAAVPSARSSALSGGLSSLLGNVQAGGVQSTPYFITRLLQLRGVLEEVALEPAGAPHAPRIIERVLERPRADIRAAEIVPAMRTLVRADVDKQTGLVTFGISHRDSALARLAADRLVAVATARFQRVVRAQAGDQRQAGEALVDSTRRQLRAAEERLQRYESSHRLFEEYAAASVERRRLERDLATAQEAYGRAMADRQAAIARELEDAPAVVIVDPLPAELVPVSRRGALKLALATVLAIGLVAGVLAVRGEFGRG